MSQALYRKKRPLSLNSVIGQEHITETLAHALKAGNINHAYLFTGPRGVGKTSVARILAHEINKLPYNESTHLDIIEIDAASNRRIDDIRDLRDKVNIAPINADYKVYIIDEVHMLTGESFNALLKTLEEPPSHVVFILATTESHKLPATIISRTQRFAFRPVDKQKVISHLKNIAEQEKIKIDDAALGLIADHGEGSFRDSISLLDQLSHTNDGQITPVKIEQTLGLAPKASLDLLINSLAERDQKQAIASVNNLLAVGGNPTALVNQICQALIGAASKHPEFYSLVDDLLEVPKSYNPTLKLISCLAVFTNKNEIDKPSKSVALKINDAPLVSISKTPESIKKQQNIQPETTEPTTEMNSLQPSDWVKILKTAKKDNPPLFSVLKQAQPVVSDGVLVLKFKFALHSKKLDDTKQKLIINKLIKSVIGSSPLIKTEVDKNASPAAITDDPTVSSVAAIMGGGEVLNAEKI